MMKKIIFIDNDHKECAEEEFNEQVKHALKYNFGIPKHVIESNHEIIYSFRNRFSKAQQRDILFQPNVIIVTWSMYTYTHYNSLGQLELFLTLAGRNDIKGLVFIDVSTNILKALNRDILKNTDNPLAILSAINNNYILTLDHSKTNLEGEDYLRVKISDDFDYYGSLLEATPLSKSQWEQITKSKQDE